MRIGLTGTGQVADALSKAFLHAGHEIAWISGRNHATGKSLAKKVKGIFYADLHQAVRQPADVIMIAVKDEAIMEVAARFKSGNTLVVHTSGSIDLNTLKKYHKNAGVLYPLQTFSKKSKIDFSTLPFCVEAASEKGLQLLLKLASSVSNAVYVMDSDRRLQLHLAAVFANNFTNHLFVIADALLQEKALSFDLLRPIILTASKNIQQATPVEAQTGPAKRKDQVTIKRHLKLLSKHKEWQRLYTLISKDIGLHSIKKPSL